MPTAKKKPARKPAPRRARRSAPHFHLPDARAAPARPDRAGARRPRAVLRVPRLLRLGRRARRLEGRRRAALAARRGALPRAGRAGGRRRDPDAAAGPARRAAVPRGRDLPVRRGHARACRPGRWASARAATRPDWWDAEWVKTRGGMAGETLDWVVTTLAGTVGAHILAVFLFIAGVLLLTGASVAGVIKATSDSVSHDHARAARRGRAPPSAAAAGSTTSRRSSVHARARRAARGVRRDARVRAAAKPKRRAEEEARQDEDESFWSGEERFPDLYGGELPPEPSCRAPSPRSSRRRARAPGRGSGRGRGRASRAGPSEPVAPEQLTPQGRYRRDVTDSPDFVWELPDAAQAHALDRGGARARTRPARRRSPRS